VGDRNCSFEGCNALEFRTSGYCLRHRGGLPDEKTHLIARKSTETGKKAIFAIIGRTEIWWIPIIPLVYPPIILLAFSHILEVELSDAAPHFLYELLYLFLTPIIILVFLSPIILPFYAVYLVRINRRRKENGTSNLFLTMFHILSFVPPLFVFLLFWVWASAQGA